MKKKVHKRDGSFVLLGAEWPSSLCNIFGVTSKNWKHVTCKKCLKKMEKK